MKPGNEKFTSSIKFKDLNPFWFQKPALVNKNCSARKGDRTTRELFPDSDFNDGNFEAEADYDGILETFVWAKLMK